MAKYQVAGPDGSTYEVTAPDNASQSDIMNYVKSQHTPQITPQDNGMSWGGLAKNAMTDLGKNVAGLGAMAAKGVGAIVDPESMIPSVSDIQNYPSMMKGLGSDISNAIQHPVDTAYKNPVSTALALTPDIGETNIGKAIIPPEKSIAVKLADELGIPYTRADATGSRAAGGIESALEKTLSGSDDINAVRTKQAGMMDTLKQAFTKVFGTDAESRQTGDAIKQSIQDNLDSTKATAQHLYSQIPDLNVPTKNLQKISEDILAEQSKLPPSNQDPALMKMANEYMNLGDTKAVQDGVNKGVTDLPVVAEGAKTGDPHAVYAYDDDFGPNGSKRSIYNVFGDPENPAVKQRGWGSSVPLDDLDKAGIPVVGKRPGSTPSPEALDAGNRVFGGGYSTDPGSTQAAPLNLDTLRSIQSDLGSKLEMAKRAGQSTATPTGRGYARMMSAIDQDIDQLSSSTDPITKMMGQDATDKLTKANSVWSTMRGIDSNSLVKSIRKADPEDVPGLIFKSGNATDVNTARAAMSDDAFKSAKQHFFTDLINDPKIDKKVDGMSQDFLQSTFNRSELDAIHKTIMMKDFLGAAEKMGGTAGSARTNAAVATGGAVGAGLATAGVSAMHGNLPGVVGGLGAAGTAAYGPKLAAKAYLKYGLKGIDVPTATPAGFALNEAINQSSKSALQSIKDRLKNNAK